MRTLILLLLAGCATSAERRLETKAEPPLASTPLTPRAGFFALPAALRVDPTRIVAAPMELTVRRPKKYELPNGLVVYLLEDHANPLVTARVLLPVGAFDDPAAKLGVASIAIDLLASGGAGAQGPEALDELLEFHAADFGASAGDEFSSMVLSIRAADVATLFPVLADALMKPRFDEGRFRVEVDRTLESIRRRPDRPDGLASRALSKAVFGVTTLLGREPTQETIKAITVDDLKRVHAQLGPRGTRLVVSGDFDEAALRTLIERHFGGWKGAAAPPVRKFEAAEQLKRRVILVPRPTAQVKVRIGGFGYQRRAPEEYAMRLSTTALGAFGVGRLYKEIRDEKGLAYSASAAAYSGPTTGQFLAAFDTKPEQTQEALSAALQVLGDASTRTPLTAAELSTATDMAVNAFAFRFDSAGKVGWERAVLDHFGFADDYLDTFRSKLSSVTPAEANAALARLAKSEALQIVIVGPVDKIGDLSKFGPVTTISDVEQFR